MDSRVRSRAVAQATRVLVIDDQRAIGEALGRAVDLEPDMACVAVVTSVEDAVASVEGGTAVDSMIVDLDRPARDVVERVRALKAGAPGPAVLVMLPEVTPDALAACARAGADAVLRRGGTLQDLLDSVRRPVRGAIVVDAATLAGLPTAEPRSATGEGRGRMTVVDDERGLLTDRELDVLRLLGDGRDTRTISDELGISVHTARGYVKSILAKLGAHTQLEAVVTAQRRGYLSAP
ncbi:MAG TPA: response regulator transcription factor [Acidimicrobiales bacterium]|nr:response regulator transcription factor [Acidimicrobiales bacterium]